MEAKHTPGPWIGCGPSFGDPLPRYTTEIVTENDGEDGEPVSICELPFAHHDVENEANARLIAAAPDLLSALVKLTNNVLKAWPELIGLPPLIDAKAAIAKATQEHA